MIAVSAQSGEVISAGTLQPTPRKTQCAGLMSGVYSTFQMIATTIGGSTIGIRNTVRNARIRPLFRLSSSAKPMPISNCNDTVQNDNFACTHSELTNRASRGSNA